MSIEYSEKLKDPRWQKKRLEIFERDGWKCMSCGAKEKTLNVHHIFYLPKIDPWEIPLGYLITFCEDCHGGLPTECEIESQCNTCSFVSDCTGPGNPPKDLIECISSLLNSIWASDKQGDFFTAIGRVAVEVPNAKN